MLDVLVVDDDEIVRGSVAEALLDAGHSVIEACDGDEALSLLTSHAFDLAVCDVQMPKVDGLTLFRRLRQDSPGTAVVLMTSFGRIPDVIASLRGGAIDYVTKPFDPGEFTRSVVGPIAERRDQMKKFAVTRARFVATEAGGGLVGTSLVMRQLFERVAVVAKSDASVLITGDRGTGKNLIARTVHAQSPRREGPFVVMPCVSLQDVMLESELRELSQPQRSSRRGEWCHAAEGGTLVLDGIDTLPKRAQSILLRIIDEPTVHARRDHAWQPRGVRLVSVSRTPPQDLLGGGAFLEPLLFRLNAVHMRVPALAERDGDLYMLVGHYLREFMPASRAAPGLTPAAWSALSAYGFPGNVRELAWTLEHAVAAADGGEIDRLHLPEEVTRG